MSRIVYSEISSKGDVYTIHHERDHYEVYFNNRFYCSSDTYQEAEEEIEKLSQDKD